MGLRRSEISKLQKSQIALVGIPFDENSSFLRGPSRAPQLVIDAIESSSANYFTEDLVDLEKHPGLCWIGSQSIDTYLQIANPIRDIMDRGALPFTLGGDHSITYPIIKAVSEKYPSLTIVQFDAHGDLYDELDGNRYSHACPFARIMEEYPDIRLIQLGIRTMTRHQREQADRFGVEVHTMQEIDSLAPLSIAGPLYVSFDMDVLDPACAPGVSHHEPGGMSTRQALSILQTLQAEIIGADVVEYNPDRDINGMTGMVAAKIVKEILARMF